MPRKIYKPEEIVAKLRQVEELDHEVRDHFGSCMAGLLWKWTCFSRLRLAAEHRLAVPPWRADRVGLLRAA
jgi:hypothetical protein